MSNRIIRDWTYSEKIHKLSPEAERFFTRLIMKVDDFGRYFGNYKLLNSNLFPLHDSVTTVDIERWVNECYEAGVLFRYEAESKPYIEIHDFNQKGLKVRRAKYPPSNESDRQELITGYVYIIGVNFNKPVKIGFSMNPWARLKEITANHPDQLQVLFSFKAEKRTESLLHLELKSKRVKNEWFQLEKSDVDAFRLISEGQIDLQSLFNLLRSSYESLRTTTNPELENEYEVETEYEHEAPQARVFENLDDRFNSAFDEIYLDQEKIKWPHLDFAFELESFINKVRGAPEDYEGHNRNGLRKAFQYQLRASKGKPKNGQQTNKGTDHIAGLMADYQQRHSGLTKK